MKTILVDGISGLILKDGTIQNKMYELLETYANPKIVLTGANDEQWKQYNLDISPYEVFTLKHDPEKTDPKYFRILFDHYGLSPEQVVYFEHSPEAAKTAASLGVSTYLYDDSKQDILSLQKFLDTNL